MAEALSIWSHANSMPRWRQDLLRFPGASRVLNTDDANDE